MMVPYAMKMFGPHGCPTLGPVLAVGGIINHSQVPQPPPVRQGFGGFRGPPGFKISKFQSCNESRILITELPVWTPVYISNLDLRAQFSVNCLRMEIAIAIGIVAAVLLPAVLAVHALRQYKRASSNARWRVALPAAVLADWVLLIAFWALAQPPSFAKHYITTRLADGFLVLSLALLISAVLFVRSWKLSVASALLFCTWLWTEQSFAFRDDGSTLSVLITNVADKMGYRRESNIFRVLRKMANYDKRGYYDAGIKTGRIWTEANTANGSNDRVFIGIASLFLKKAQSDRKLADVYVNEALSFRDKALPIASDANLGVYSMSTLRDLALISESAGDLSPKQRCVQYRNSVKLLDILVARLRDKQDEIARRFAHVEDDMSVDDVKCLTDEAESTIARMRDKQQSSGCR
jgi:hypothetical protein